MTLDPMDAGACLALAQALGDTPETVISVHLLTRGACRAYAIGEPSSFRAALIQADDLPEEPMAFGYDPDLIWQLLRSARGWKCVNVPLRCRAAVEKSFRRELGKPSRCVEDVYHALMRPAAAQPNADVRRLTSDDLGLFEEAAPELRVNGFGGIGNLLEHGYAAGAVVDGRIVGLAHTYAISAGHADVGVFVLEDHRRRGYATAAASIVARCVQGTGRTPVWSAGAANTASLRVAEKLGFEEVMRRVYVVPVGA